jgi:polyisoprenoid-binding protein YceI
MRFMSVLALIASLSAADTYSIDPAHTAALFKISHLGISNSWGRFNGVSGTVTWEESDPAKSSVKVTIKTASIDTGTAKKDEHLRSADFFSVKEFPEMTFASKKIEKKEGNLYQVTGDFTLHGVTKEITIPVTKLGTTKDPMGKERIGFDAAFSIKRSDYGMNFMVGPAGDEVQIILAAEGAK